MVVRVIIGEGVGEVLVSVMLKRERAREGCNGLMEGRDCCVCYGPKRRFGVDETLESAGGKRHRSPTERSSGRITILRAR